MRLVERRGTRVEGCVVQVASCKLQVDMLSGGGWRLRKARDTSFVLRAGTARGPESMGNIQHPMRGQGSTVASPHHGGSPSAFISGLNSLFSPFPSVKCLSAAEKRKVDCLGAGFGTEYSDITL